MRRAKWMLAIVAFGLFISGVTIWPAVSELEWGIATIWGRATPVEGTLHAFVVDVLATLKKTAAETPYLLYGYDWLAFAHIVLAILFAGAMRDPVKNVWVIECGLIMCALVPVLAGVCIPLRGLPPVWFLFDAAFASGAAIPLGIALRDVRRAEKKGIS